MLGLETLYSIRKHLERELEREKAEGDVQILRRLLRMIYEMPEYAEWLKSDQFYSATDPRSRFRLRPSFGKGLQDRKWLLERFGLLNGDILTAKIEVHEGRIHITDGNWVPAAYRVYPFIDESYDIVEFVKTLGLDKSSKVLIDPACGCGHHALGLAEIPIKINLDVNPRALEFARINGILANVESMFCAESDIRRGLPKHLELLDVENIVVPVNMPFAIFPTLPSGKDAPKPAQDGGNRGIELTEQAVKAIANFKQAFEKCAVVGVILCYSLGVPDCNRWDIEERAENYLGIGNAEFKLLSGRYMWRVSGQKEQPNPMPIRSLALKAGCIHTYRKEQMEDASVGYHELVAEYSREGWTHLGYGLLIVR